MALWEDYSSGGRQRKSSGYKRRKKVLEERYGRGNIRGFLETYLSDEWIKVNSKNCPHCFSHIEKYEGCNHMTCSRCRHFFCWNCLAKSPRSDHFSYSCPYY